HALLKYVLTILGLCLSNPTVASWTNAQEPGIAAEARSAAKPPPDPPTNMTRRAPHACIVRSTTFRIAASGSHPSFPRNHDTRMSSSPPRRRVGSVNARSAPVRFFKDEILQNIG